jgi:tetratricopeptide (TPR) repeat protein
MPDPFIGRTLAHYRIAQRLGSGGMGVVYSALDLRLDRRVAVKILSGADAGRDRLLHEARAASALTHPHVAAIHAVEEVQAEGVAFIVMEYVEGEPLSAIVARGPLDQAALVRYGVQIADAVAHAHRHRVIHCDLKSHNVVVTLRRGLDVDPLSLPVNHMAGVVLSLAGRTDEAIAQFTRTLEMEPGYSISRNLLAAEYERRGMDAEAFAQRQQARERSGASPELLKRYAEVYAKGGMRAYREEHLKRAIEGWNGWHGRAWEISVSAARSRRSRVRVARPRHRAPFGNDLVAADVAGIRKASRGPAVSGRAGTHYHAAAVGAVAPARTQSGPVLVSSLEEGYLTRSGTSR